MMDNWKNRKYIFGETTRFIWFKNQLYKHVTMHMEDDTTRGRYEKCIFACREKSTWK